MSKYSKIKLGNNHHTNRSRSIDFSDLTTFPKIIPTPLDSKPKTQEPKITKTHKPPANNVEEQDQEEDTEQNQDPKNGNEEGFPNLKLTRNSSVSSSSNRFRFEKQSNTSSTTTTTTLEDAVKRAFSVRRSSSVSERYSRIHDQGVTLSSSPLDEDDFEGDNYVRVNTRSMGKKNKKQSKILKACKRFFGL